MQKHKTEMKIRIQHKDARRPLQGIGEGGWRAEWFWEGEGMRGREVGGSDREGGGTGLGIWDDPNLLLQCLVWHWAAWICIGKIVCTNLSRPIGGAGTEHGVKNLFTPSRTLVCTYLALYTVQATQPACSRAN